jgi:hypothetical protein
MYILLLPATVIAWVGHGFVRAIEGIEHVARRR